MGLKRKPDDATASISAPAPDERAANADEAIRTLRIGTPTEKRMAVRVLAAQSNGVETLLTHLEHETDHSVQEAIFTAFEVKGGKQIAHGLVGMLRTENAWLRNAAIETLSKLPDAVATVVPALLNDSDPDVRIFTVNMLGELAHPDVARWLSDVMRHEDEINVVAAAIEVLAEVGSSSDLPLLARAVQRFESDPFIAFAADMARQRIEAT